MSLHQSIARAFDRSASTYDGVAVVQRAIAQKLLEQLTFLKIQASTVVDLGAGTGFCGRKVQEFYPESVCYYVDIAPNMLAQARLQANDKSAFITADAAALPIASHQVDLVVSNLTLQWCADLPAVFKEVQRILRPGGVFLFSTLGPDTLQEVRQAWAKVDDFKHVNVFCDMHDIGDLLLEHRFSVPVVTRETIEMRYASSAEILEDLRQLGSIVTTPKRALGLLTPRRYRQLLQSFTSAADSENSFPLTYEALYGIAWVSENKLEQTYETENHRTSISLEQLQAQLRRG